MKTIKLIDILVKIANGEEVPKIIKWEGMKFAYSEYDKDYLEYPFSDEQYIGLFNMRNNVLTQFLNDEAEIIEDKPKKWIIKDGRFVVDKVLEDGSVIIAEEDKKIEKLDISGLSTSEVIIKYLLKINELIDKVNGE